MPEMRRLVPTAVHVVRRPANRRKFLLVKADTSDSGGDDVALSDPEIEALQKILDAPIEKEDEVWQKLASALKDPTEADEITTRQGLRLLSAIAQKSEDGAVGQALVELGLAPKLEIKQDPESKPKPETRVTTKLELPEAVIAVMKAAGVDEYVSILKGLETSPEVATVFMPLVAALCTTVQKQGEALAETADEKRGTKIAQAIVEMGLESDQSALVEVLKGVDDETQEKILEALKPSFEKVKEADDLLLTESGTEARKSGDQTALSKAEGLARQLVSKGEAEDFDSALEQVWKDHPQLYDQHRAESYSEQVGGRV